MLKHVVKLCAWSLQVVCRVYAYLLQTKARRCISHLTAADITCLVSVRVVYKDPRAHVLLFCVFRISKATQLMASRTQSLNPCFDY